MKQIQFILIVIICSVKPSNAQETAADLGVMAIGLVVSDIESSEYFYTEIIGMVPAGEFSLDSEWSEAAGAANGKPFSVKMFRMQDRKSATILKLAYFDATENRPEQNGLDTFAGVNYLTINYSAEAFSNVIKRIEDAGIRKTGWVKKENYQLFFVRDPNGVFVELIGPPDY